MRAFRTTWQAIASFYNELFMLVGVCLLWWVTGGIFVGLAFALGWAVSRAGMAGWWLPLVAIPAGPATAALAEVTRQAARDLRVDRSFYWDGLRRHWRQALAASAVSLAALALLILNAQFYAAQRFWLLQAFAVFWFYLALLALGVQLYLYPTLAGLTEPSVWRALRTSVVLAFANPFYTALLVVLALILTGVSVAVVVLLLLVWPALMVLMGERSLMLFLERAGKNSSAGAEIEK